RSPNEPEVNNSKEGSGTEGELVPVAPATTPLSPRRAGPPTLIGFSGVRADLRGSLGDIKPAHTIKKVVVARTFGYFASGGATAGGSALIQVFSTTALLPAIAGILSPTLMAVPVGLQTDMSPTAGTVAPSRHHRARELAWRQANPER